MRFADPKTLVRLLAHKGLHRVRRWRDEHGGWQRATGEAGAWGAHWAATHRDLAEWLDRPGAGQLWVDHHVGPRWARRTATDEDVGQANAVLAGTIPRIGADPATGHPPAWLRDGYSGEPWPLEPASQFLLTRGDGSDIRTVWELSRCYHLVSLARAFARTRDDRYTRAFKEHVEDWLASNPPGLGPNWISPMDAAIRAANWGVASVLLAKAPGLPPQFWGALLANLRLTARYVERNLEWHPVFRGNHYVSNALGLLYVGALFRDDPDGRRWLHLGARILEAEILYQVHPDGSSFEGSTGYHRLVTEFFAFGAEVGARNLAHFPSPAYRDRLERMYQFLEAGLDAAGRAPLMGDADDGRLHHLCAAARDEPRRHLLGLPGAARRGGVGSRAFPEGGWYILKAGADRAVVHCGPVGLAGAGSHDHNDQLSLELVLDGVEVIGDSGTYCYTRDLRTRLAYRATAAHNVPQLGAEEQNPIREDMPWRILADRARSRCLEWRAGPDGTLFEGEHHGFAHRPSGARCTRRIEVDSSGTRWTMRDRILGTGAETLAWRLHFAPGTVNLNPVAPGRWVLTHGAAPHREMELRGPETLDARLEESPFSERYGGAVMRPMLVLSGPVTLPLEVELCIVRTVRQGVVEPGNQEGMRDAVRRP